MEKAFSEWFYANFLEPSKLSDNCFSEITSWSETEQKWVSMEKKKFLAQNSVNILNQIEAFKKKKLDFFITKNGLNQFIFSKSIYDRIF